MFQECQSYLFLTTKTISWPSEIGWVSSWLAEMTWNNSYLTHLNPLSFSLFQCDSPWRLNQEPTLSLSSRGKEGRGKEGRRKEGRRRQQNTSQPPRDTAHLPGITRWDLVATDLLIHWHYSVVGGHSAEQVVYSVEQSPIPYIVHYCLLWIPIGFCQGSSYSSWGPAKLWQFVKFHSTSIYSTKSMCVCVCVCVCMHVSVPLFVSLHSPPLFHKVYLYLLLNLILLLHQLPDVE